MIKTLLLVALLLIIEIRCEKHNPSNVRKKYITNLKKTHKECFKPKSLAIDLSNKLLLSKVSKVIGQVKKAPTVFLNSGFKRESMIIKSLANDSNKKKQILSCSITNKVRDKEESLNYKRNNAKFNLNFNIIGWKYYL